MAMVSGYPWLPAFILIPIGSLNPDSTGILPVLNYQIAHAVRKAHDF
jgi:hypothetical protein